MASWEQRLAEAWTSIDEYDDGVEFQRVDCRTLSQNCPTAALSLTSSSLPSYDSTGYRRQGSPVVSPCVWTRG